MPDPDTEHGLKIQLATALKELDEAREQTERWLRVTAILRENLNTTLLERDALRVEVQRLRDVLKALLAFPGSNAADHEKCDEECPYEQARAALATGGDRG